MSRAVSIGKVYRFEAAHRLPFVPDTHKCSRVHGHNYRVILEIAGGIASNGFCNGLDFFDLDATMRTILEKVDHRFLNDVLGLENPTAELIAVWFRRELAAAGMFDASVTVYETDDCWARCG